VRALSLGYLPSFAPSCHRRSLLRADSRTSAEDAARPRPRRTRPRAGACAGARGTRCVTSMRRRRRGECGDATRTLPIAAPTRTCPRFSAAAVAVPGAGADCIEAAAWGACGGLSSTPAQRNAADAAYCCARGTTCTYLNDWFWQCIPSSSSGEEVGGLQQGTTSGSGTGDGKLNLWDQCGGAGGNCHSYGCADAPFSSASCPAGAICQRSSKWYYQCVPASGHQLQQQPGGGQGASQPASSGAWIASQITSVLIGGRACCRHADAGGAASGT
jgi:hypothetical protein